MTREQLRAEAIRIVSEGLEPADVCGWAKDYLAECDHADRVRKALEPFAEAFNGMPRWGGLTDDWKVYLFYEGTRVHHIALTIEHFKNARDALSGKGAP